MIGKMAKLLLKKRLLVVDLAAVHCGAFVFY